MKTEQSLEGPWPVSLAYTEEKWQSLSQTSWETKTDTNVHPYMYVLHKKAWDVIFISLKLTTGVSSGS